jgi:hypothetical protein
MDNSLSINICLIEKVELERFFEKEFIPGMNKGNFQNISSEKVQEHLKKNFKFPETCFHSAIEKSFVWGPKKLGPHN